jgi:hypothetical protein
MVAQAQAPAQEPAPSKRELAKDPAEREKQLAAYRGEAATIIAVLGAVVERMTPTMPLGDQEKASIQGPLEQVLFKYDGTMPCEWQLGIALAFCTLPRYPAWKEARAKAAAASMGAGA